MIPKEVSSLTKQMLEVKIQTILMLSSSPSLVNWKTTETMMELSSSNFAIQNLPGESTKRNAMNGFNLPIL